MSTCVPRRNASVAKACAGEASADPHQIGVEPAAMGKNGRGSPSPLSPTLVLRERLRDGPLHTEGVWSFECRWRDTSSLWAEHSSSCCWLPARGCRHCLLLSRSKRSE